jgi:hypothetical protein
VVRWQSAAQAAEPRTYERASDAPKFIFERWSKLTVALHRALGDPNNFDRRRHREAVLQRLIALERRAIERYPYGAPMADQPG